MKPSFARALALLGVVVGLAGCSADPCNDECPEGTVCDAVTLACVDPAQDGGPDGGSSCLSDLECHVAGREHCEPTSRLCVACFANAHCESGSCDTSTFTCVSSGCSRDQDCADQLGTPFCGSGGTCVECRTSGECQPANGQRRTCDLQANRCVPDPCLLDADCVADPTGNVCELVSGLCVGCLEDFHCPSAKRCLASAHACVDCLGDEDCDADLGETCEVAQHTCVATGCAGDASCAGPLRCRTETRACVRCLEDLDCAFGGTCADASACAQPATCAAASDCIWPARCDGNACVECQADADCKTGQSCVGGACTEPASCAGSAVCGPNRACTAGACAPATCTNDALEPNDATAQATALDVPLAGATASVEATLCPNEVDSYGYVFQQGAGAEIRLRFDAAKPPLSLELVTGQGGAVTRIVGVLETAGVVRAVVENAPAGSEGLLARVAGGGGELVAYKLETRVLATGLCSDDSREDDDTQAQAPLSAAGTFNGVLCSNPELDWIALDVPADFRPEASLVYTDDPPPSKSAASVEIYMAGEARNVGFGFGYAPGRDPVQRVRGSKAAPAGGARYWVLARANTSRKLGYRLEVAVTPKPPINDACGAAELLLPHDTTTTGHTRGTNDDVATSCGGEGGGDVFWTLELAEPSRVFLDLTAGFEAALAVVGQCDGTGELACTASGTGRHLRFDALPAGKHLIVIDALGGGEGAYALATDVSPATPAPAAETCSTAESLTISGGTAAVSGALGLAADDFATPCGGAGSDALYAFELTEARRVKATLTGFPGASISLVPEADCETATGALCVAAQPRAGGFEALLDRPVVEPGRYRLVVDGGSFVSGRYQLQVALLDALYPPPNDICEDAAGLLASQIGDTRGAANDFTPACGAAAHSAGDAVYRLTVVGEEQVDLALNASFDAALSVTESPCGTGVPVACASGTSSRLRLPALTTGEYFVWVDGFSAAGGSYTLTSARSPSQPVPANDTCEAAEVVVLGAAAVEKSASTSRAADDVHPTGCASATGGTLDVDGRDVVYEVSVPAGKSLRATLTPTEFDGALYVLEGCASTTCRAGADRWFQEGVVETVTVPNTGSDAATWRVVVDSFRPTSSGIFTLRLELL